MQLRATCESWVWGTSILPYESDCETHDSGLIGKAAEFMLKPYDRVSYIFFFRKSSV
jgi:hypothetical protein